ncbi:11819_t:CDS:2 [Entrophospora sp. SA101]|nr:11819_t:CDS:2 [Entrophospora sp. SA101]
MSKDSKNEANTQTYENVLFIRNLSFDATEEELSEIFLPYGELVYCVITRDKETGHSRGTGFVNFKETQDANNCLLDKKELTYHKSILTPDPSDSKVQKFTLQGRVLSIVKAVDRTEAKKLMENNKVKRQSQDKRNLYLMKEGVIFPDTFAAKNLPKSEFNKRFDSFTYRKNLLTKNPNLYISKTRLSIRNLPLTVDERQLKELAINSIQKFKNEVKNDEREDLSAGEKSEGWNKKVHIIQAKIIRSKDRIDPKTQKPKPKGYGFIETTYHSHALAILRYLNNNPEIYGDGKRLTNMKNIKNNLKRKPNLDGDDDGGRDNGNNGEKKRPKKKAKFLVKSKRQNAFKSKTRKTK